MTSTLGAIYLCRDDQEQQADALNHTVSTRKTWYDLSSKDLQKSRMVGLNRTMLLGQPITEGQLKPAPVSKFIFFVAILVL